MNCGQTFGTVPTEHSVDKLADNALQAAATKLAHRLARGVPPVRGAAHRLRECGLRLLRGTAHPRHTILPSQLRYADKQGRSRFIYTIFQRMGNSKYLRNCLCTFFIYVMENMS